MLARANCGRHPPVDVHPGADVAAVIVGGGPMNRRAAHGNVCPVIELNELTKRYGRTTAVDRLTVTVRPGHVTGFLGPNGSGKSTTLRMILGLTQPTSGSATVNGHRFRDLRRGLRHVGALLDAGDVHGGRSARNHLAALAVSNGIPKARVDEVLHEVGLADVAHRRIGGYSFGMRQRLGIAGALLGDPPVLLFDEPINGLDPEGVHWLRGLLRRLAGEGRTVLLSSHLMTEMQATADQLIVLGRGRLLAAESVTDFANRGTQPTVFVRASDGAALAAVLTSAGASVRRDPGGALAVTGLTATRVGELALENRILVHQLTTHTASLEEAFMELTADSVEYLAGDPR
jgi:ABC-2 type transport system ATP-binding protein